MKTTNIKKKKPQEGEQHHDAAALPMPTAGKVDLKTARDRLNEVCSELGVKVPKVNTPAEIRSALDAALKRFFLREAPKLADDPEDCFGKPEMRDPKHPYCKKCVHLAVCGEYVDKALAAAKGVAVAAEEEIEAEEEADTVEAKDVPKSKKNLTTSRPQTELLTKASFKKWPEFEVEIRYAIIVDLDEYEEGDLQDFVKMIIKKRPATLDAWRKEVMGFTGCAKSEANSTALEALVEFMDFGIAKPVKMQ